MVFASFCLACWLRRGILQPGGTAIMEGRESLSLVGLTEKNSKAAVTSQREEQSKSSSCSAKQSWKTDFISGAPSVTEHLPDETISASTLCFEAKKKTSLPIDVNVSTPSSSTSSDSENDESMYVVSKLRDLPKLHRAVWRGDLLKVKSICNGIRKTVLNTKDKEHRTALHYACVKGATEIISYICSHLKSIIDVNLKDSNGCTPMHKLIDNGHGCDGSLEHLLNCGGNLSLVNNFGHTPLHLAARHGDTLTTSFLIFKGASVHAMDKAGRTPLHLAAQNSHEGVITNLIMYGADIKSKDKMGRTPVMLARKEKIGKFMCDLISDQEQRHQLLTEADYSGSNITDQEISCLQPPREADIRAMMLNEWNAATGSSLDSYTSDYEESCSETNSCLSYDSAQKDNNSFQSACWGNLSDSTISRTTSSEFASLRASPVIEVASTKDVELDSNLSSDYSVATDTIWKVTNSSSKNSLERYYSVASAFNCEHFKSMENTGINDRFSIPTPATHQSDCSSCSAAAAGTPRGLSGDNKLSSHKRCDHQYSDMEQHTHTEIDVAGQTLTNNLIHKQTSGSLLVHTEQKICETSDLRDVLQKPVQFTEDVMEYNQLIDHTSQQNSTCNLKDHPGPEILEADHKDQLVKKLEERLEECEKEKEAFLLREDKAAREVQVLAQNIENGIKERRRLIEELEDARGANQELILTLRDVDEKRRHMVEQFHSTQSSMREQQQKLNAANVMQVRLQAELEKVMSNTEHAVVQEIELNKVATQLENAKISNEELTRKLMNAEFRKAEALQQATEAAMAKRKLQLEVAYAKNAYEELVRKLEVEERAKRSLVQDLKDVDTAKEKSEEELDTARKTIAELKVKLTESGTANKELVEHVEDTAAAKMELVQELQDARSEIEALKQRVNETFSSKEDLIKEVDRALVAKMELFQELQNAKSVNEDLEEQLKSATEAKEELLQELATIRRNEQKLQRYIDFDTPKSSSEATVTQDDEKTGKKGSSHLDSKYKREVVELSRTLESMNSELLEMMKFSEQQVSDVKIMKDGWVMEKNELSRSLSELSSTLEKEMKEKEETLLENSQLKQTVQELKQEMKSTSFGQRTPETSHLNFLEAKSHMLNIALESAQCRITGLNQQITQIQQDSQDKDTALHKMENRANSSEDEAEQLRDQVKKLNQTLAICKRRIIEQNENNAHLVDKNKLLERICKLHAESIFKPAECNLCSAKIKSLECTIGILRKEVEHSQTSCSLLEENGKYAKTEIHRLHDKMSQLQAKASRNAALLDEREKDSREEEKLQLNDKNITTNMRKVKNLAEQQQRQVHGYKQYAH